MADGRSSEACKKKHSMLTKLQWKNLKTRKKMSKAIKKALSLKEMRGIYSSRWNGGIKRDKDGYLLQFFPSHPFSRDKKYVLQHRLVVEQFIGRYLKPEEHVHHLGEKDDNRLEMLMCFATNSAHIRFHNNPGSIKKGEIIFDGRKLAQRK